MLDFLYGSGWGAFTILLLFQVPFLLVFLYVVFWKAYFDPNPSGTDERTAARLKGTWLTVVIALFLIVNIASIQYIPAITTANAAASGKDIIDVDVAAVSWSFDISQQEFETGQSVRFTAESTDTVHGFAIYHPSGGVVFTMMLVPGVGPSSLIHTFDEPGTYKVRCLEYCGMAHQEMSDEIIVTEKQS